MDIFLDQIFEMEQKLFGIVETKHDPNKPHPASIINATQHFQLPIELIDNDNVYFLKGELIEDLELIKLKNEISGETIDLNSVDNDKSIYKEVFNPSNKLGDLITDKIASLYTVDKGFLKDTQTLLQNYKSAEIPEIDIDAIINIWTDVKTNGNFRGKYKYMEWKFLEHLNNSAPFLQMLTVYNIATPIISLLMPFMALLVPFVIIQAKRVQITFKQYLIELKQVLREHAIGKLIFEFNNLEWSQRFYLLLSIAFYFFQIYQDIQSCIDFYNNMKLIHNYIKEISCYINYTVNKMDNLLTVTEDLYSYSKFNEQIKQNKEALLAFYTNIKTIDEYKFNVKCVMKLGYVLKQFYELYTNESYNDALMYSFGFNGYINAVDGLKQNIDSNYINYCNYLDEEEAEDEVEPIEKKSKKKHKKNKKNKKHSNFKDAYYVKLMKNIPEPIKNSYNLKKNSIITGPNAAGKTTILKTTIINMLLSQQIGAGCYSEANINLYDYFYCYLNIPDTSGRDSLFQAEARQCKNIIQEINRNKNKKHFCIFDELYSGTNPHEAINSAYSFLDYLTENNNVNFMLTTHYYELCKKLKNNKKIKNQSMKIYFDQNNDIVYTYILKSGVSRIKGGAKVLTDLNYPKEILDKLSSAN